MSFRRTMGLWLAVFALMTGDALAQGTTVQLPTYSFSSVSTTVNVPDQGSALLGGVSRAATGVNEFGVPMLPFRPFRNRSIGQDYGTWSMRVTATIHDFDAMEAALLGTPPSGAVSASTQPWNAPAPVAAGHTLQPRNPSLAGQWSPTSEARGVPRTELVEEQARRVAQQQTRTDEAEAFFERARQAETEGKLNVARIYYQMVIRRAAGDLKQEALARLESIGGGSVKVAQSHP